jgi:hypothetical protein
LAGRSENFEANAASSVSEELDFKIALLNPLEFTQVKMTQPVAGLNDCATDALFLLREALRNGVTTKPSIAAFRKFTADEAKSFTHRSPFRNSLCIADVAQCLYSERRGRTVSRNQQSLRIFFDRTSGQRRPLTRV